MTTIAAPAREDEIADAIADAARGEERLAITGGGSKAGFGAPAEARTLAMTGLTGVVDYDPAELVLTVRPGTPLADVEALIGGENQMLAFDPFDHGPLYGLPAGRATIGGVVAAGVAGSQRISAGGARDHLLGFRAVSGRGEVFIAGGKVVKNVTGYDLPKLAAGSWGRLFVMTELTLKVLPRPSVVATRLIEGLDAAGAVKAMAIAMGSQADIGAAAHLPKNGHERSLTAFRIQGFGPSVAARCAMLETLLAPVGAVETPDETAAARIWADLRSLAPLGPDRALWRINVAPSKGSDIVAALRPLGADWMMDWAGGLIWAALGDPAAQAIRAAAEKAGGHAALVRGSRAQRASIPAFHPPAPGLAALETRVRRAFDPMGVFETGRFA